MNELKDYLNSNREYVITLDLNDLVDKAIKYLDYISELVEQKSNKKLFLPDYSLYFKDFNTISVDIDWYKGNHSLFLKIYEDYDFARYDYWDETDKPNWCHNDHKIGTELDSHVLDTLLLFTEDK